MSSATDFVGELYRAANEVARLPLPERRRLIERALGTIADQRETLSSQGNIAPYPSAIFSEVRTLMNELHTGPDILSSHLLLECADEIRRLHILIASE